MGTKEIECMGVLTSLDLSVSNQRTLTIWVKYQFTASL